jgi:F-type H+-transporting ATPase subunit b
MSELFGKLGLDWKLLLAQVINFFILLWVLKRYAYKPILGALQKRTSTIEKSLDDAKKIEDHLSQLQAEKDRIVAAARSEAGQIVERARKDADVFVSKSREQAQSDAHQIVATATKQVTEMKDAVMSEAQSDLADLVVAATEKVVRLKIAGAHDEKMVHDVLTKAGKHV